MKKVQFVSAMVVAILAGVTNVSAQDAYGAYGPSGFEGIYAGGYVGGMFSDDSKATGGFLAGANFEATETVVVGAEAQAGLSTDGTKIEGDALMLAKAGALISPETMVYVAGGGGISGGKWTYAVGGGAEYLVTQTIGARGEVIALTNTVDGWTDTKATVGVVLHVK